MTEDKSTVKYKSLCTDVIGKDKCNKIQKIIMSIDTAKDLGGLFELTTAR